MNEFVESLCIMNAKITLEKTIAVRKYIDFTIKTTIDNQERIIKFRLRLTNDTDGRVIPINVFALKEKDLHDVSEEEYQLRVDLKIHRNELLQRLKEENSIRLHALFL